VKKLEMIWHLMNREMRILWKNPIYGFCMVVFPIAVMLFFTTLMDEGLPQRLPIGVVDVDNTACITVLKKHGFVTKGILKQWINHGTEVHDVEIMQNVF